MFGYEWVGVCFLVVFVGEGKFSKLIVNEYRCFSG